VFDVGIRGRKEQYRNLADVEFFVVEAGPVLRSGKGRGRGYEIGMVTGFIERQ